jgi:hypothetical protein
MQTYILRVDTEVFGETLTAHATEADAHAALSQIIQDGASKNRWHIGTQTIGPDLEHLSAAFEKVFMALDQFTITPVDVPDAMHTRSVETALCIWEWINDVTLNDDGRQRKDWCDLRENVGSMEMRWQCMDLAKWADQVFDLCIKVNPDIFDSMSFDWEVVPRIMGYAMCDGAPAIYPDGLPSPNETADKIISQILRDWWFADAKAFAEFEHGYPEMLEEGVHFFEQEMLAGTMPQNAVRRYAEAYDLITRDPIAKSGLRRPVPKLTEKHLAHLKA